MTVPPTAGSFTSTSNNMVITYDTHTESNGDGDTAGTDPFDHTTGNFEDRVLLVAVASDDSTTGTIDSVTYDGVTLNALGTISVSLGRLWAGYLVAPAVGTNSVNLVWAPAAPTAFRAIAITFYNVYQTDPIGQTISSSSENTIPTEYADTINPDDARGMIVDFYHGSRGSAGNAKTPQTEKGNITGLWTGGVNHIIGASYLAHTGSNTTMEWENLVHDSSAADQFHWVVELREKPVAQIMGTQII